MNEHQKKIIKDLEGLAKTVEGAIAHAMLIDGGASLPHLKQLVNVFEGVVRDIIVRRAQLKETETS